jgi:hypothetical protein
MEESVIRIYWQEHRLVLSGGGFDFKEGQSTEYNVATAKYATIPKYWSTDYRNPQGRYRVTKICREDSEEVKSANAFDVPWYLSSKSGHPYEDAGTGVYGAGMIVLDYPNNDDLARYTAAKESGELRIVWGAFCRNHLKPLYQDYARLHNVADYREVRIDGDYGNKTYPELLKEFPIIDPQAAFRLGVGIHGTNDPACVGEAKSAGCFRMHDKDLLKLMEAIEVGMSVEILPSSFYSM